MSFQHLVIQRTAQSHAFPVKRARLVEGAGGYTQIHQYPGHCPAVACLPVEFEAALPIASRPLQLIGVVSIAQIVQRSGNVVVRLLLFKQGQVCLHLMYGLIAALAGLLAP